MRPNPNHVLGHTFTVFCKLPDDPRGYYSEEIDVVVSRRSEALALKAAQQLIDTMYDPELRPVRAVWRPTNWW